MKLSFDAKVVGAMALGNWLLLLANHTVIQVTRDGPLWQLFPGSWGVAWMVACLLLAIGYPLRDLRLGARFSGRDRVLHLAGIVALFVVVPTIAEIVLRATGKPYTYVHDGAIMVEEAARALLAGRDPYSIDYLGTPLFYWPMINNPALYHFTYFPVLFLVTTPLVALFDHFQVFFDERYLYLPAYIATIAIVPLLIPGVGPIRARRGDVAESHAAADRSLASQASDWRRASEARLARPTRERDAEPPSGCVTRPSAELMVLRLSLVAIVALDPQLFPFVAEGRNDFFLLAFLFAGIALLQRERGTLGVLMIAIAASAKLHAALLLPFLALYIYWRDRDLPLRARAIALVRATWAGALLMAIVFVPFLAWDLGGFLDDVVAYNAGGAAWSYPISGMGFSAILRAIGVISYPQQDFPFWAFQIVAGAGIAVISLRRLRADPTVPTLLASYAAALLAFLFFGRYFQGSYLGYIVAVAAPVPFLRPELATLALTRARALLPRRTRRVEVPAGAVLAPVPIMAEAGDAAAE